MPGSCRGLIGSPLVMFWAALVAELDFSTAKLHPGSFVDEQLRERHSDLLWSVRLRGRETLIYVLLEHQGRPDPLMPYRLLRYMVRIWDRWLRDHPKAKRLPAVIPLVLYQGPSSWRAPKHFADLRMHGSRMLYGRD